MVDRIAIEMSSPKANISFFIPDDENDIQDSMPIQGTNKISIPSEDYYTCYVFGQADFDRIQSIDFYLNGIVGFPMGLLGILNNLIFLGVLTRATMRKSIFNQLLVRYWIYQRSWDMRAMEHNWPKEIRKNPKPDSKST